MKKIAVAIQNHPYSFHILIGGIVLSIAFYMYCINAAVRSAVVRNNAEESISNLQAKLSELESTYMLSTNTMTIESALALGLHEPTNKVFISKTDSGKTLSYNGR